MARFLHQCEVNVGYDDDYHIRWIPFNKNNFINVKYLAKGDFGEVHKAFCWIDLHCYVKYREVVLKKIYNSDDKISDILKEVDNNNKKSLIITSTLILLL